MGPYTHFVLFFVAKTRKEKIMPDDEELEELEPEESEEEQDEDIDLGLEDEGEETEEESEEEDDDTDYKELSGKQGKTIDELTSNIKNLNAGAYKMRKALEAKDTTDKDEDGKFTDTQLLGMLREHKDDDAVQLQIMKHVSEESSKKIEAKVVDAAEIAATKKQVDSFITKNWPEINEEGSDLRKDVDEAKKMLRIEDHPYSDYLGIAAALVTNLPDMITAAEERGKSAKIKDKNETNRKQSIKDNKLSDKGRKIGAEVKLPAQAQATAKQLGLTKSQIKIYKQMLGPEKGKQPITVEV
jgi:hypothetical protein